MVGVPRSNGCRNCLDQRIKCDETHPECKRCRERGAICPGYKKILKFCPQKPMLKKSRRKRKPNNNIPQHHRHDHNHDNSFALPVDPVFEYVQACRHHRLILPRTSIDETFAPNLVRQALNTQHREIFCTWIMMNFPCLYSLYATQVDINILDYMRHYPGALPEALVGAVCALNTLHLSNAHNDPAKVASSRAIYSHGLTRLSAVLQGGMQDRTDDVHLAAILLGFYEILDGTSQRSWLAHSRGITDLFRLRGPALLCSGIGRTLFVSYRSFVVTEAFISRQACLFEEEQWKVMINNTIGTGRAQGKYCWLVTVWEQGLNEIIMCPGYMVRAQGILSHAKPGDKAQKSDLITQIRRSRDELSRAVSQLAIALTAEGEFSEPEDSMGAISADFRHVFIPTSLQSMRTAINLLGRLLSMLLMNDTMKRADLRLKDPWDLLLDTKRMADLDLQSGLDCIAMSMGLLMTKSS